MSISNLGSNQHTDENVIGSLDTPAHFTRLPGDEVVIGSYDPLANTTPASDDHMYADDTGVGTWDPLSNIDHVTIMDGCNCAACQGLRDAQGGTDDANPKNIDPTGANPEGNYIGELLPLGTNPDGSHFFTGNRNVDATLIGSKWGTLNLTYSFPTSGSNYNGSGYDTNGVSLY
ncbi:MAG: hypothetical protein EOO77_29755, partial [Oxalobacteraceae bacterium]